MKRKYFLLILVLVLAIFLSGCSGGIPTTPGTTSEDETSVKSVIYEYFLAISYQNWSKAKSYCVYGSDRYYATITMEQYINSLAQYGIVTVTAVPTIYNVSIYGSEAEVYMKMNSVITVGGYPDTFVGYGYYYLQKVGNNWKIYGP